jgi:EmrB/QacA subfamily drug resistance transporter
MERELLSPIRPAQRRLALLVAACFFMELMDATIVVTALPRIGDALSVRASSVGVIVSVYFITLAVFIPVSGWLTARFGGRRVLLAAIALFTLASVGCASSTTLAELIAWRVLQGVGGALMVPVGRILVFAEAGKDQIMRLMAYIIWPALLAPVLAPLIGGVITTYAGWRWLFLINVPLGATAFLCCLAFVHAAATDGPPPLDRRGVALTCGGLALLTVSAQVASEAQPRWTLVALAASTAAVLLALAARHLLRAEAPLVDLRVLRIGTVATATAGLGLQMLLTTAIPFLLPLLFQTVFGWSAIKSGALVLFVFVGNIAIKPATTWIFSRFGFRDTLTVATTLLGATTLMLAAVGDATPLVLIAAILVASGVMRSIGGTGFSTLGLSDVPREMMNNANTLLTTGQQLFAGLGVAVATLALRLGEAAEGPTAAGAYRIAFIAMAMFAFAACALVRRLEPTAGRSISSPTTPRA